ncbi:MAG: translation initiation factor IF-3 [Bacillota bacterium]
MNEAIRVREVRVISPENEQLGIMPPREAIKLAAERNLDLVEIAPTAKPPVCRIMDYGRYKFEQSKKEREARKKQKIIKIKEVQMRPNIEQHDFDVWVRRAEGFLKEGDKIKAIVKFRGREIVHAERARNVLKRFADALSALSTVERDAKLEGRNMIMIVAPREAKEKDKRP